MHGPPLLVVPGGSCKYWASRVGDVEMVAQKIELRGVVTEWAE